MSHTNPFHMAQQQVDESCKHLGLDEATNDFLRWPMNETCVTIPLQLDDGSMKVMRGYRVQYNNARGPSKGGLRWHPEETVDTVRALAAWMTWKTALVNIPLGGAKGGVTCNPKELSDTEKQRLARGYIRKTYHRLGVTRDVPAPDVYTTPQIMAWMMDEYETIVGENHPGVITGKPVEIGGSYGRSDATARGGIYAVREACKALGTVDASHATYAIQGFGNAGQNAAILHQEILGGGKLIAVSDSNGAIISRRGIDPKALVAHKMETGTVTGFPETETLTHDEILELEVDVLYPAALESAITNKNAPNVKAKIIAELANGPTTPEADKILHEINVFVIPDLLANSGGVTVSYFEQVQNSYNYYWSLSQIHEQLDLCISDAFRSTYETHRRYKVDPTLAATIVAVKRVAEACKLRGWI